MVENVVEDSVEPKPGKNKAFGEASGVGSSVASGDVKPEFKVKIHFQAHIVHNQARPVPTSNFEEKPKAVPTGARVIEENTWSFFYNK